MTKKIMCVLTALIVISISISSIAATESELNNKINEIQNSISEAEDQIDDIQEEADTVTSEIEALNKEIAELEEEITAINNELEQLNNEIDTLEAELEAEQAKYDEQYETLCTRLVAQYKMGNVSYLDVLLNSKSLSDFISKYYIIGKIAEYDTELLESIEEQKTLIENSKAELEEKQSEVSAKQSELKLQEITLTNKKSNKNKYLSQLSEEQKELQATIHELNEQEKEAYNELAEIAKKASQTTTSGYVYTGGVFTWPCPSYSYISSYFGWRSSGYHRGIDMAASHGSAIVAAADGVVISVTNTCTHDYGKSSGTDPCGSGNATFGNYIMISHGNGLVTLYAHCMQNSFTVSVGDTVTAGQQIASVGSTGASTGYHLHFSVIVNGTYVNPASYLGM